MCTASISVTFIGAEWSAE